MSARVAWAMICFAVWIGVAVLTWRGSPKFRALYPSFQSGPFWAVLSHMTVFLVQPAIGLSKALLGGRFGEDSNVVYAVPFAVLMGLFLLIQLAIPSTRRATIAFEQHLMRKPVTGRLRPEPETR